MVTEEEKFISEIQEDFNKVITYTQNLNCDTLDSTPLLHQWYEAKKEFIDRMGGKLIMSSGELVTFELSEKEKEHKYEEFLDYVNCKFYYPQLSYFLREKTYSEFFDNITKKDYNANGISVPAGMKFVKSFKKFVVDKYALDAIQTYASMIIQENKIEGKLYYSVHPLDFLSISENNHNWRSCHALDGEFRGGNLSYMCDSSTVICYLCSDRDEKVILNSFPPDVQWNSKKWRLLMFLNKERDVIFAGRQYPFFCDNALNKIQYNFIGVFGEGPASHWSYWHDDVLNSYAYKNGYDNFRTGDATYNKCFIINHKFKEAKKLIKDKSYLHFNDLLNSSVYKPYYCWNTATTLDRNIKRLEIGSEPLCPVCGKRTVTSGDSLLCSSCFKDYVSFEAYIGDCEICGREVYEDGDPVYASDQDGNMILVCPQCAEAACIYCGSCGNLVTINDNVVYDEDIGDFVCHYCHERKEDE